MTFIIIRILDILISVLLLIIFSPIFCLISVIILIIDGKPVIYKQSRVGYLGKIFIIFKFRTMKNVILKDENLRVTFLGRFLRKTSLDELPQLINVLKKDMSIVGPRPLPEHIEKKINRTVQIKRRKILPGITGLSQVNFTGKNRKLIEKMQLDLKWLEEYSLNNYFKILIKTPFVLIVRLFKNKSSIIK